MLTVIQGDGQPIRARDERKPDHFWADKEIVEDYLPEMGAYAFSVYMLLCYYARAKTGRSWPSIATLAKKLKISKPTIRKALDELAKLKLILISETRKVSKNGKDIPQPYVFTLIAVKKHKDEAGVVNQIDEGVVKDVDGGSKGDLPGVVNHVYPNKTNIEQDISNKKSIAAKKPPRAKAPKAKTVAKEKRPRTPQRTDPLFDAIGKHIFSATTPAAVEAVNFRIGQIIYGDKRRTSTGLLDFETQRQGKSTAELDYNQLAQDVGVFWKNFQKNHPDLDLKDCVKVMEWWIKFRAAQDKQTQATDSGQAGYDENRGVWYRTVNGKREELDPAKGSWEAVA